MHNAWPNNYCVTLPSKSNESEINFVENIPVMAKLFRKHRPLIMFDMCDTVVAGTNNKLLIIYHSQHM